MCACMSNGYSLFITIVWVENIANAWLPYINMRKLQKAVTLILRRESKFLKVKFLISTNSSCSYAHAHAHVKIISPSAPESFMNE